MLGTRSLKYNTIQYIIQYNTIQVAASTRVECNKTVESRMTWFAYRVKKVKDPASQTGLTEELTEIQINETVAGSYQTSVIDIPPRTLDYGLHKLVFKFELETGVPGLPLYKTAYTYVNITKSPLVPVFIKGSVAKVFLRFLLFLLLFLLFLLLLFLLFLVLLLFLLF